MNEMFVLLMGFASETTAVLMNAFWAVSDRLLFR